MPAIAQSILWAAEIYLAVGVFLAVGFAVSGIGRVLPEAADLTFGARLITLPAAMLLWPIALYRWRSAP